MAESFVMSVSIDLTPERRAGRRQRHDQLLPQPRVAARQLRLRKTHTPIEGPGNFLVRPALDVVEPDDGARERGKARQRAIQVDQVRLARVRLRRAGGSRL